MIERYKAWNLKYLNLEFDINNITQKANLDIATELNRFPDVNYPLMAFSGNIVGGNLLFNYIVKTLIEIEKIRTKAYRISFSPLTIQDFEIRTILPTDILLIDTIEFRLLTEHQQSLLSGLIEELTNKIPLTILNITETNLNYAPKTLKDMFSYGITIGIKK